MCRNELGEFYRWWIFVGVRPLLRVPAPAALVLPAHLKLTSTYRAERGGGRIDFGGKGFYTSYLLSGGATAFGGVK